MLAVHKVSRLIPAPDVLQPDPAGSTRRLPPLRGIADREYLIRVSYSEVWVRGVMASLCESQGRCIGE